MMGGFYMDKEEILNKSRNSRTDEGFEYFDNKGRKIGYIIFWCVAAFMVLFNKFNGKESHSIFTLLWVFSTVSFFTLFRFNHKIIYLFVSVISFMAMVDSFIRFIIE
jgi:hypothetical protein